MLPKNLAANPRLSRWVSVSPDGTVTVRVGKVEIGQGILTALAQIAADELDVDVADVRMMPVNTADSPDEGTTAGSLSILDSGSAVRQVCAEVRSLFLAEAIASRGLDSESITIRGGVISDRSITTSYGELATRVNLDRDADGSARPKDSPDLRLVGTTVARLDLPDKIAGRPRFIHDLTVPGQMYGRVVRPPSPAATLVHADVAGVEALLGVVCVVRDGRFLGVVADTDEVAERAAAALAAAARWHEEATLPDEDDLPAFLRSGPQETFVVDDTGPPEEPPTRVADVRRIRASYSRPFLAHASMAPSCGVARWADSTITVWSHSQGVFALQRAIAATLGVDGSAVTVHHVEGAGCYGHNGADDAAFDAVLLARAVPGRPVRVLWSRGDELSWAPFGSAMAVDLEAGIDDDGHVTSWSCDVFSQGHVGRPGSAGGAGLLAAAHLGQPHGLAPGGEPPRTSAGGLVRNAIPDYDFPRRRIAGHRVLRPVLRTSSLRSLGAFANVFAIESFMDELALAAGHDPLEYRLAPRARAVLTAAATLGGWRRHPDSDAGSIGHGLGFARYKGSGAYCAVMAEVSARHEVRVLRLAIAVDVGRVINPDGVRNQIEGGAVQATSWTLKERVRFDRLRITSTDWDSYPILRFSEVPAVEVEVLSRPDEPAVGAGEAAQGPTAAAIANAVADALSVRVRDLPITSERILAAINT